MTGGHDRPFLDGRGCIRALGSDIAEDAAATKIVRAAGFGVPLVDDPFEQPLECRRMAGCGRGRCGGQGWAGSRSRPLFVADPPRALATGF